MSIIAPIDIARAPEKVTRISHREPTILQVADAARFESYREVVRFYTAEEAAAAYTVPDLASGLLWRFGVLLRVVPAREQFVIRLRAGAGPDDLAFARRQIEDIRAGHFHDFPWEQRQASGGGVLFTVSLARLVGPHDHQEAVLRPCDVDACLRVFHEWWSVDDDPMHLAEEIPSGECVVQVTKYSTGPWTVYTDFDGSASDMTPDEAIAFASDLRWAAATARKLNSDR